MNTTQTDLPTNAFTVLRGAQRMADLAAQMLDHTDAVARAAFQARIQAAGGHEAWMLLPGDERAAAYAECRRAAGCGIALDLWAAAVTTRSEAGWLSEAVDAAAQV